MPADSGRARQVVTRVPPSRDTNVCTRRPGHHPDASKWVIAGETVQVRRGAVTRVSAAGRRPPVTGRRARWRGTLDPRLVVVPVAEGDRVLVTEGAGGTAVVDDVHVTDRVRRFVPAGRLGDHADDVAL